MYHWKKPSKTYIDQCFTNSKATKKNGFVILKTSIVIWLVTLATSNTEKVVIKNSLAQYRLYLKTITNKVVDKLVYLVKK